MTAMTEGERMANVGKLVTLKKLGDVQVRELTLEKIFKLASELAVVLTKFQTSGDKSDDKSGTDFLVKMFNDPVTFQAVQSIASASTDRDRADFVDMGVSDWLKLIAAFKEVIDWEEMRQLFMAVVPVDVLSGIKEAVQRRRSENSATTSPASTSGL